MRGNVDESRQVGAMTPRGVKYELVLYRGSLFSDGCAMLNDSSFRNPSAGSVFLGEELCLPSLKMDTDTVEPGLKVESSEDSFSMGNSPSSPRIMWPWMVSSGLSVMESHDSTSQTPVVKTMSRCSNATMEEFRSALNCEDV